jgi:integrase
MSRHINRLSPRFVQTAKPKRGKRRTRYLDGGGLHLDVVASSGGHVNKSWFFLYERHGRRHTMGLGPLHTITLAEARERGRLLRQQLLDGVDPLAERRKREQAAIAEKAKATTFEQCCTAYVDLHGSRWSKKHGEDWWRSMRKYVLPKIGKLAPAEIDTGIVSNTIRPLWLKRTVTASRTLERIAAVWDWAKAGGFCSGDNPARAARVGLPKESKVAPVTNFAAVPYSEIGTVMAKLGEIDTVPSKALRFAILTAARAGEILGATWPEIVTKAKVWTVPAERMKRRKEHKVPLSAAGLALLESLPRDDSDLVFGGIDPHAMRRVLAKVKAGVTVHGFRSAFMDWAHEQTAFPKTAVDMALAHKVSDKVEAAYRRGDLFEKRRKLMEQWARFCMTPKPVEADKRAKADDVVVPIRGAAGRG